MESTETINARDRTVGRCPSLPLLWEFFQYLANADG